MSESYRAVTDLAVTLKLCSFAFKWYGDCELWPRLGLHHVTS